MIIIMLIYAVSFKFQLPAYVAIHNQCSNTKLLLPIYFSNGAACSKLSDQQIDIGKELKVIFKLDTIRNKFGGALLFKLRRHIESDDQYNIDASTTETDESEAAHVYMLVALEVKDTRPFAYVALVEHTKEFTWNEGKLKKLYYENHDRLKEYTGTISDTWLVDNNIVLKTTFSARHLREGPEVSISISEEKKSDDSMRPFCINLKR
jgi:hypothetical protein